MLNPGEAPTVDHLVNAARQDALRFAEKVDQLGASSPQVVAQERFGLSFESEAATDSDGLQSLQQYYDLVDMRGGSAWMDNTTLVTAAALMSGDASNVVSPLTMWDLATFARAVVSFDRVYHHEHGSVDDVAINRFVGDEVLQAIPLPEQDPASDSPLPDPWHGAHRFMCEVWGYAYGWLTRLAEREGSATLDGQSLDAVRDAWNRALGRDDLRADQLVDWPPVPKRWMSPSNLLLREMAGFTSVEETSMWIDPTPACQGLAESERELGRADRLPALLTDLNLRAYVNQAVADFLGLPYISAAARVPFRRHLYDRAVAVQHRLVALDVIDDRYAEIAASADLRLPVPLAVSIRQANRPEDVWAGIAEIRSGATDFRRHRVELDRALARQDRREAVRVAKALSMQPDNVLAVAAGATVAAGVAVVEQVAKGDVTEVASGIAAVEAAGKKLLDSTLAQRLVWRLRRPHLLWINDIAEESTRLTEALPDTARIWRIPDREVHLFAERFRRMGELQSSGES